MGRWATACAPCRPGDRGSHVREVQLRLRQQGFLHGSPDGVYGEATSRAVLAARKSYHLRNEDIVDGALYTCLGILSLSNTRRAARIG